MRHGVFVLSDEIHCDIVMPGYRYTPFASLSEEFLMHSATCTAPTKTFNIAGTQIANITAADEDVRSRIDRAININEVCDVNPFGVTALQAAYNHGEEWLEQAACISARQLRVPEKVFRGEHSAYSGHQRLEATYLVWLDCSAIGKPSKVITDELLHGHKLWLNDGEMYGEHDRPFVRVNIACPRSLMLEGLKRFERYAREELGR